jgi:hypothetical protein
MFITEVAFQWLFMHVCQYAHVTLVFQIISVEILFTQAYMSPHLNLMSYYQSFMPSLYDSV